MNKRFVQDCGVSVTTVGLVLAEESPAQGFGDYKPSGGRAANRRRLLGG